MIQKLLIANRGEIACRIIKTAQRMGIRTVAVYSTADINARHVRMADEAIAIGGAESRESYLHINNIIRAAHAVGAQAIHPGYGFLSENAEFAQACLDAGLIFIGPPVSAIIAMGLKSESKALMAKAGVPLTPGYHGVDQSTSTLQAEADKIGYPLLIKASAGGGGKGMRVVEHREAFLLALTSCQREAQASFGNADVLLEKYLIAPRHIEMQVFADRYGNVVHLYERDCSAQRRHQKVVEEAPAPNFSTEQRESMAKIAIQATKAVRYEGAGTVEFIVASTGEFYFMEMNTRLQVEHPVTEMVTGIDLVEWQIRIAEGEVLPLTQSQILCRGHAIEVRIYAEDADQGFLPSSGLLSYFSPPKETPWVRVDRGVDQGDAISPFYDPMIAKLIVWEPESVNRSATAIRQKACHRLLQALADFCIVGVTNNLPFLSRLIAHPSFMNAQVDTGLIERDGVKLMSNSILPSPDHYYLASLAEIFLEQKRQRMKSLPSLADDPHSPWDRGDHWRLNAHEPRCFKFRAEVGEKQKEVTIKLTRIYGLMHSPNEFMMQIDEATPIHGQGQFIEDTLQAVLGDRRVQAVVIASAEKRYVFYAGQSMVLTLINPHQYQSVATQDDHVLTAPMTGKVIAHCVPIGASVKKNESILILTAMKMEYTISAPCDGVVRAFCYAVGEQIAEGELLVEFEPTHQ